MAIGYALSERLEMHSGQVLNPSLADYKIPTTLEMPKIETLHLDVVDPIGPFGAKEVSEGSIGSNVPAIANAVRAATGVEICRLPIVPEDMLKALDKQPALGIAHNGATGTPGGLFCCQF